MGTEIKWTDDQENAINHTPDSSACVSAAAGSGKTALLVERVVRLIRGSEEREPVSGDKFAILTFTRNAADEFRARMTSAIDKASRGHGDNTIPREQLIRFRSSVINTINAFCLGILKENAELFGLPVNFSIVEDSKGAIMRDNALDNAMEYFYSPQFDSDFPGALRSFGGTCSDAEAGTIGNTARELLLKTFSFSTDKSLREAVTAVYQRSTSLSDDEAWLDGCVRVFSDKKLMEQHYLPWIVKELRRTLVKLDTLVKQYEAVCKTAHADFVNRFLDVAAADRKFIDGLKKNFDDAFPKGGQPTTTDFEAFSSHYAGKLEFGVFSRTKIADETTKELYDQFKESTDKLRKKYKDGAADLIDKCAYTQSSVTEEMKNQLLAVCALIMIVRKMSAEFTAIKEKAGVVDFADCERKLLNKLREKDCPLREALENRFECIIIDEFQDTNDLQYEIFRSISRDGKNMFFVGDIKQSIYAFRGGNPEIMARCCAPGSGFDLLPLNKNFRSRETVINSANAMFDGLMTKEYGEVDYANGNGLTAGAKYPGDAETDHFTEIHLMDFEEKLDISVAGDDKDKNAGSTGEEPSDELVLEADDNVAEARYTAALIQKMAAEKFQVRKDGDSTRPCTWGDFTILLRSNTHVGEFKSELEKLGIPVSAGSGSNYLSADEINLIFCYLKVIDNPQLDEELLTVLMSPLYGFTAEELSLARLGILGYDLKEIDAKRIDMRGIYNDHANKSLFYCISAAGGVDYVQGKFSDEAKKAAEELAENEISRSVYPKCKLFLEHLNDFRTYAANNSIERLIRRIYDSTDFFSVISTYERGDRKLANIRLLLKYTADFERSGGGTLNDFLRYTDAVRENAGKLDEAVVPQEAVDAVKIMTFHASKGLEMPIVILAGLGHDFHSENKNSIIIERNTGIGLKNINIEARLKTNSLSYKGALAASRTAQIGDELRLLYVAMTRAKEKLIMIGKLPENDMNSCVTDDFSPEFALIGSSFIKWIICSYMRYGTELPALDKPVFLKQPGVKICVNSRRLPEPEELAAALPEAGAADEECAKAISRNLASAYPHESETKLQSRYTVTQIAHMDEKTDDDSFTLPLEQPGFLKPADTDEIEVTGALRGNTYHHVMELIPLETLKPLHSAEDMEAAVENELDILTEKKLLPPEERAYLNTGREKHTLVTKIANFFLSDLGQDMLSAEIVEREYDVFAELSAEDILPDAKGQTFVQGRVDMLFVKDGQTVVVDYKTDKYANLKRELPAYSKQVRLYQKILPMLMTECRNGEIRLALYSFDRQKAIFI